MAINYHAAQDDFGSIVHRLQPMVLTNFVMWLDMKVAEFKVYGQMLLENENREIPNWYLRPNFDSETLVSMAKQKIQVPVSLVPKKVINKQTVHVPILPSHRNRSTRSQSATKLKNDTDKVIDSLEPTIVKHPRLHHAQGIDMLQEETDSSALTFVSKEYSQSDSPLYSTTRLEVSECEKRHMPSEETLNTSVEALDTSVEAIDSSQADSQCTARVVPKAEPVDEEFEVIENRLQTSTLSDTVDMLEHNIPLHDASVSSAIKTPLSTEKVAKTLVQSDGTMFLMPQTDKDATDTSVAAAIDLLSHKSDFTDKMSKPFNLELKGLLKVPHPSHLRSAPTQQQNSRESKRVERICKNLAKNQKDFTHDTSEYLSYCGYPQTASNSCSQPSDNVLFRISDIQSLSDSSHDLSTFSLQTDVNHSMHAAKQGWDEGTVNRIKEEAQSRPVAVTTKSTRRFKCRICPKTFPRKLELHQHVQITHGSGPESSTKVVLDCKDCGLRFMNMKDLGNHMTSVHDANSEMLCRYCGKQFQVYQHYAAHINRHQGIKPYECPQCKQTFTFKFHFTRHFKKCGDAASGLQCPECSKVYMSRRHLSDHIQGVHNAKPRYVCSECGEQFVWQGALIRHRTSRHKKS